MSCRIMTKLIKRNSKLMLVTCIEKEKVYNYKLHLQPFYSCSLLVSIRDEIKTYVYLSRKNRLLHRIKFQFMGLKF